MRLHQCIPGGQRSASFARVFEFHFPPPPKSFCTRSAQISQAKGLVSSGDPPVQQSSVLHGCYLNLFGSSGLPCIHFIDWDFLHNLDFGFPPFTLKVY